MLTCATPRLFAAQVVSADANGKILTWDTRTGGVVDSYSLEDPIHISHIQVIYWQKQVAVLVYSLGAPDAYEYDITVC